MDLALHRKKDHVITDGILITRYMMVIYRDLENGVQKKTYDFICSLYVVNECYPSLLKFRQLLHLNQSSILQLICELADDQACPLKNFYFKST